MSSKSSFEVLGDAGGSCLGLRILIKIWIWSLVVDTHMLQILAVHFNFQGAMDIHIIKVLIWGFGGHWRVLTGIWDLELDLDIFTGL